MVPASVSVALAVSLTVVPSGCGDATDVVGTASTGVARAGTLSAAPAVTMHPATNILLNEMDINFLLRSGPDEILAERAFPNYTVKPIDFKRFLVLNGTCVNAQIVPVR